MAATRKKISDAEIAEMKRRYAAGGSITRIARSIKRSHSTVSEHVNPGASGKIPPMRPVVMFGEPAGPDPAMTKFIAGLTKYERHPAETGEPSSSVPHRYQPDPVLSCEGSQSAWSSEN